MQRLGWDISFCQLKYLINLIVMRNFTPTSWKRFFGNMPSFSKSGKYALTFLNMTQFLGVINDNVFKFVMAFLLIDALGVAKASSILSATGAIYVIPFLLFSSSAGILADRFSKQKLLVIMKVMEMVLMFLAIFAFSLKSVWGCYTLLFFLSMHSALFGPSKYGIIPELVPPESVSKANGLITSFTYLAIITGTFLASFLTEMTNRHFTIIAFFCLAIAIGGFLSSLAIKQTTAQGSQKKMNFFFVREIFQTLKYTRTVRHLLTAIFGSSFFLMIGAFTQLNIIPFAIQSLNLSEVAGGYLFLATALGIALGAFLAGKASRKRVELGLSCIAGVGISFFFLGIAIFSSHLYAVIICLIGIGLLGGAFIVPFDTFIQVNSHNEKRGQTIAASNFLSFTGVLIASFSLYFFNQICGLTSAGSFAVMGLLTLVVSAILCLRLSDLFLPYLSRKIIYPIMRFKKPDITLIERSTESVLILENSSYKTAFLLAGALPNIHYLIPAGSKKWHWYYWPFYSVHKMTHLNEQEVFQEAKRFLDQGLIPCLVLEGTMQRSKPSFWTTILDIFRRSSAQVLYVRPIKDSQTGRLSLSFEK